MDKQIYAQIDIYIDIQGQIDIYTKADREYRLVDKLRDSDY